MIVFRRKNLIIFSVFLATILAFFMCLGAIVANPASDVGSNIIKVVLDAGHGGIDSGAVGNKTGVKESEINLKIVKKLEKLFISAGMSVTLTRNSEAGLYGVATSSIKRKDMEKRRDIINEVKPDIVISVHLNKYSLSTRRGAQVFYSKDNDNSKILANCIQNQFNQLDSSIRDFSALKGDYYILNCTEFTSIIAECGFLSNPEEELLLVSEKYQEGLANSIFSGTVEYLSKV